MVLNRSCTVGQSGCSHPQDAGDGWATSPGNSQSGQGKGSGGKKNPGRAERNKQTVGVGKGRDTEKLPESGILREICSDIILK